MVDFMKLVLVSSPFTWKMYFLTSVLWEVGVHICIREPPQLRLVLMLNRTECLYCHYTLLTRWIRITELAAGETTRDVRFVDE